MANNFSKHDKGINIEPSTVAGTAAGDLRIDSAASNVPKFHDGSSEDVLVRRTATETLTNKTVVVASNTVTTASSGNLAATELNAALAELQGDIDGREPAITTLSVAKGGTNSGTALNNNRVMQSSGSAIVEAAAITASRALVSNANGIPTHATTTSTEIGYLNGVTSAVQTQLDAKVAKALTTTTGDMIYASGASTPARLPIGSSGQVLKTVGGLPTWATFSGGINYLSSNPDAESDTTGWSTYADAAASTPVDGTGGSPDSTWTRSTSSPLRGSASFLFTHNSGASRQGEGVSFDFTIDTSDKAKVLNIEFDYLISSGTFVPSDSDLTVYIYDVTNATLIQPSSFKLLSNSTTIADKFTSTFQTASNSTSYRLILHCASTSTSAFVVQFDNFKVGPSNYVFGTPITDWQSFTPTGTWATNTTYTGQWRRVGDTMEIRYNLLMSGAATATSLNFDMVPGYTIDSSKINLTQYMASCGTGILLDASGLAAYTLNFIYTANQFLALFNLDTVQGSGGGVNNTSPITIASGDNINAIISVPILGWSSSVQMSDSADTRVITARAYRSGNQSVSTAAETDIVFNATSFDDVGGFNTSTGVYTVQVPGKYRVKTSLYISSAASEVFTISIYKTGVQTAQRFFTATADAMIEVDDVLNCVAGDTIKSTIDSTADTSYTIIGISACTFTTIERISGPSAIAASESVNARYTTNAGQSISNATNTIIDFEDKEYDSHGAVTIGASWKFTASISGVFNAKATITSASTGNFTGTEYIELKLFKNGSFYSSKIIANFTGSTAAISVTHDDDIKLLAGDYIDFRVYQVSGASLPLETTAGYNFVSIKRIGN